MMSRIIIVIAFTAIICKYSSSITLEPNSVTDGTKPVILTLNDTNVNKTGNVTIASGKETIVFAQLDAEALNEHALNHFFYVVLVLSTSTVSYVVLKVYRVRKGGSGSARRGDVEMKPLHSDNEEKEDHMVFDVRVHANRTGE